MYIRYKKFDKSELTDMIKNNYETLEEVTEKA
jgi:hypothetical protein